MTLVFTEDSPINTTLVDGTSGVVMYKIETNMYQLVGSTIIRKPSTDPRGEPAPRRFGASPFLSSRPAFSRTSNASTEVGKIHWRSMWPTIIYNGQDMRKEWFSPRTGTLSSIMSAHDPSSFFITVDGTKYRWSTGGSEPHLPKLMTDDHKKTVVAELHRENHDCDKTKVFLSVAFAGVAMLDQIVVSLVYVEKKRRANEATGDGNGDGDSSGSGRDGSGGGGGSDGGEDGGEGDGEGGGC